jgi:hypothetical protein
MLLALGVALLPIAASAQSPAPLATINDMVMMLPSNDTMRLMILGVGKGFEAVNIHLEMSGKPKIFCQPDKLAITGEQYTQIVSNYVNARPTWGKVDSRIFPEVMLQAMIYTFPCPAN